MSIIDELNTEIDRLRNRVEDIQTHCSHPAGAVTRVSRSDTGNWCKQDDEYWYTCKCSLCQKQWDEPR